MTYREHYAGLALLGLMARTSERAPAAAAVAVEYADALCKALDVSPHDETLYNLGTIEARKGWES